MDRVFKEITYDQWQKNEKGLPVEFCVIDGSGVSVDALDISGDSKYKESYTFYFDTSDAEIMLVYRWDINGTKAFLFVYIHSDEDNAKQALKSLFSGLKLQEKLIVYVNEEAFEQPRFRTLRVDDNANEIEITRFHVRSTAEFYVKRMEAKGHKQLYFVRETVKNSNDLT